VVTEAAILGGSGLLVAFTLTGLGARIYMIYLLDLFLEAMYGSIVTFSILEIATVSDIAHTLKLAAIGLIRKDRIVYPARRLADSECERSTYAHLGDDLVLDGLKARRMAPDLIVSNADLTIVIRTPNHDPVVLVHNHDEGASHDDFVH